MNDGGDATFRQFEDIVLPLLAKYGGELVLRLRPDEVSYLGGTAERPYEVHVVRFAGPDDLARYRDDDERRRALPLRDASVRRTVVITGTAE